MQANKGIGASHLVNKFIDENTDRSQRFNQVWSDEVGNVKISDALLLARTLYDTRELKRVSFVLKPYSTSESLNPESQSALFLYNYALLMHGSQRKEEEIFERNKSKVYAGIKVTESSILNSQAKNILSNLERLYEAGSLDDLNTYLLGLVYVELGKAEKAAKTFIRALNLNPCLWSAWQELLRLILQEEVKIDPVI